MVGCRRLVGTCTASKWVCGKERCAGRGNEWWGGGEQKEQRGLKADMRRACNHVLYTTLGGRRRACEGWGS